MRASRRSSPQQAVWLLTSGGSNQNFLLNVDKVKGDMKLINENMKWHGGLVEQAVSRLPSGVRISFTPFRFRGGRNGIWVGFSRDSPVFHFYKFHSTISPHSAHQFRSISFSSEPVVVLQTWSSGTYSQTFNVGASSRLVPWPGPVSDTSWGGMKWRNWKVENIGG